MTSDERMNDKRADREPRLGLWDAVSLVIGIVVGTSIFRARGPWQGLGAWLFGGVD
jgi:basic amino acid/polyamine antiporter, APA family